MAPLHQRLVWITLFRTIATTLLLVVLSIRLLSSPVEAFSTDDSLSFLLVGIVYLVSIGYALSLRGGWARPWLAYVQVVGDIGLATLLIARTGGLESPFTFVFLLAVVAGAVLLGRRGAILACALGGAILIGRILLLELSPSFTWLGKEPDPTERVIFQLCANLAGLVLTAWLSGYLSEQLLRTGGRLVQREADLKALAHLQGQILDAMPSGLITCTTSGEVTFLNRAAAQILQVGADAEGLSLEALIPGGLSIPLGSRRNELSAPTRSGKKILGLSASPLTKAEMLIVFQDLTALREAEDALRRTDKLAALGRMSAQLAHEIRNPLAAMRGSAQLLADDPGEDRGVKRLATILVRESDRLGALLNDFLRFARPAPPDLRPTALHDLVAQTLEMFVADPLSREVRLEKTLAPVWLPLDADQMRQVLLNLLRNACSAVGPGGTVRVEVETEERSARLRVWDSGGSIAAEDLPNLFEPFFSKRPGGTGLGLSTAHSIVRAHGGEIRASSAREMGTEFVISLPREPVEESLDSDRR